MIYPQWLELPMSRINFSGPKDVGAIEVHLYMKCTTGMQTEQALQAGANSVKSYITYPKSQISSCDTLRFVYDYLSYYTPSLSFCQFKKKKKSKRL